MARSRILIIAGVFAVLILVAVLSTTVIGPGQLRNSNNADSSKTEQNQASNSDKKQATNQPKPGSGTATPVAPTPAPTATPSSPPPPTPTPTKSGTTEPASPLAKSGPADTLAIFVGSSIVAMLTANLYYKRLLRRS